MGGLGVPGGFVGVDVFFVISGFLITSLILKDLQAGSFSLASFWERRARRIIPAAVVMVIALLPSVSLSRLWREVLCGLAFVAILAPCFL